jgi:hypothetical protein
MADEEFGTNSRIMQTLRTMAWERAKGELQSMLHTYWSSGIRDNPNSEFHQMDTRIGKFIKDVEDNT